MRVITSLKTKRHQAAVAALFTLLVSMPVAADTQQEEEYLQAGKASFSQGRMFEAERDFLLTLEENQNNEEALLGLAEVYLSLRYYDDVVSTVAKLPNFGNNSLSGLRFKALALQKTEQYQGALIAYMRLLEIAPNDPSVIGAVAGFHMLVGNPAMAEQLTTIRDCLIPEERALKPSLVCQ